MSLVNAVHTLLEVAAGRLNLTPDAVDELHASIDAEQNPPHAPEPIAENSSPQTAEVNNPGTEPPAYPDLPAWRPS